MLRSLDTWLEATPIEDPIDRRQAVSLQRMLLGLLAVSVVGLPISLSTPAGLPWLLSTTANAIALGGTVLALALVRRGRYTAAVVAAITLLIAGLSLNLVASGFTQVRGIVLVFALPIALAGLLIGRRALMTTTAVIIAIIVVIAVLERLDPPLAGFLPNGRTVEVTVTALILSALLVAIFLDQFSTTLRVAMAETREANERLRVELDERRRLEAQLIQARKMEGIGRLAGGVAHDFNNLLVAIGGYADLALESLPPGSPATSDLREIQKATDRAAGLTRQLLAFARRQISDPQVIDLGALAADMEALVRRLLREDIELVIRRGEPLWPVRIDPSQAEQVIVNLVVNARDAMPAGGRLVIETANVTLDDNDAHRHAAMAPGPYVMLAISDTGVGMSEEVQRNLFEPFFTTKEIGRGTGLGLATCYGIVKQNNGFIWVYSELGQGTTVRIYLPMAEGQAREVTRRPPRTDVPGGTETVLLAEDEEAVRMLAARALRDCGYTVIEAADGQEAIAVAESHGPTRIALLVTDVIMPRVGGRALADALIRQNPALKVLYISGYTDSAIVHHGRLEPGTALLQKPFTPAALARKVREVLEA